MSEQIDPATLARPFAEALMRDGGLEAMFHQVSEREQLAELGQQADKLDLVGGFYFVDSGRSILMPAHPDTGNPITSFQFEALSFEGQFSTYSTLRLDSAVGASAIRALCLTFDNVTLLPYLDTIPSDKQLYVPAFAVQNMDRVS